MQHSNKFSIPAFRRFVPNQLRPWIIVLFVIVFQFSGGIYLASVGQMVGSLSLMQEDIMMAGYASMAGMALVFTIMFRLRFRFTTKIALMICCTGILLCTLICMHTSSVPLLVAACFVSGFLRMWGTFTCNTIIQLWITPKRDLSIFFCYIYFMVQSAIQLSGLLTAHTAHFAGWKYMHLAVIGLLLCVMLAVMTLLRSHRDIKKLPLYGIDWMGGLFTWQTFARRKWRYRTMNLIALCCIAVHLMLFYFQIDFNQSKQSLLLPIFLRSFGYVVISITFLTSLARLPWLNFPQALSVQAFVSAGFGSLLGTAIVSHSLKYEIKSNALFLGGTLDRSILRLRVCLLSNCMGPCRSKP